MTPDGRGKAFAVLIVEMHSQGDIFFVWIRRCKILPKDVRIVIELRHDRALISRTLHFILPKINWLLTSRLQAQMGCIFVSAKPPVRQLCLNIKAVSAAS